MTDGFRAIREAEFNEWVARGLAKRTCPYSGMMLTRAGEAGPDSLSCGICDCFGFAPDDPRIGAR